MKTLDAYMKLPYKMEIVPDTEEGGYVVSFPELPGCLTCADTLEQAVINGEDAKREWITAAMEEGIDIPEPVSLDDYSGQFKLRIPKSLHHALATHAKEEGIIFDLLTNPKKINVDEKGNITSMTVVKMELGEPDASGRRRPVEIEGSEYDIEVDTVIMSLGTSPNPLISSTTKGLETNRRKCIVAEEENGQTSKEGVFAGGDAVTGAATVILAMGAGKAGAKGIDEYLRNK